MGSKLVDSVLAEDWSASPGKWTNTGLGVRVTKLRAGQATIAEFDHNGPFDVDNERARQCALGHRALKALVDNYDEDDCPACNRDHDPCDFCTIVAELRGGK